MHSLGIPVADVNVVGSVQWEVVVLINMVYYGRPGQSVYITGISTPHCSSYAVYCIFPVVSDAFKDLI